MMRCWIWLSTGWSSKRRSSFFPIISMFLGDRLINLIVGIYRPTIIRIPYWEWDAHSSRFFLDHGKIWLVMVIRLIGEPWKATNFPENIQSYFCRFGVFGICFGCPVIPCQGVFGCLGWKNEKKTGVMWSERFWKHFNLFQYVWNQNGFLRGFIVTQLHTLMHPTLFYTFWN